ncbi:MAG: guanylate kinase [Phycisphaeraceae bacterium]|nr:guanylate kinase [Phycisphaeraceae bacterium]
MVAAPGQAGLLLIISGPSGAGKSTIAHEIEKRLGGIFSVSVTTRAKTNKDVEGRDYHFVDRGEFERLKAAGEFLESAEVFGNMYGTPRTPVDQAVAAGRLMILEIDVQGGEQVKAKMPQALAVFILPPSEAELLRRLRDRGRDTEEVIQKRFAKAQAEVARAKAGKTYDRYVVNVDLEKAIAEVAEAIRARMGGG